MGGVLYQAAALTLVVGYVNTFQIWQTLVTGIGPSGANLVPLGLVVLAGAGVAFVAARRRRQRFPVSTPALAVAFIAACAAVLLCDPAFPAKRIHLPQYAILALVVGRALAAHLDGLSLLAATSIITALLGGHDELLQGVLPDRTFGLRDIAVNTLSGLSGALLTHAFHLKSPSTGKEEGRRLALTPFEWLGFVLLAIGWLLLLLSIPGFRGEVLPVWTILPLAGGAVAWGLLGHGGPATGPRFFLVRANVLMLSAAAYPLSTHAFSLVLH